MGCGASRKKENPFFYDTIEETKDFHLITDSVCPHVQCKHSFLSPDIKDCIGIPSEQQLDKFRKECNDFFVRLRGHNGPLSDPSQFHRFMQSGRLWIVHLRHIHTCDPEKEAKTTFNALEEWYATLMYTYEKNIYNPNRRLEFSPVRVNTSPETNVCITRKKKSLKDHVSLEESVPLEEYPITPIHTDFEDNSSSRARNHLQQNVL